MLHSAILAANKNSHEPVEKVCVDCGEPFDAPVNRARDMRRCPACQERYAREQIAAYQAAHRPKRETDINKWIGGKFRILHDPGRTWTARSSLDKGEIKQLARLGYLETGTQWTDGETILTVCGNVIQEGA